MIAIIIIQSHPAFDSDHLINVEIGPVEEMKPGVDTAEPFCNPLEGKLGVYTNYALVLLEETCERGEIVVNSFRPLATFSCFRFLRRIL
jgi:hypothetical protein